MTELNPLPSPSTLPYQLPDFGAIAEEHYAPAIEQGFAEHRAEIDAIASNSDPATFENTLVALERSGQALTRVLTVFFNQVSADSTDALLELEEQVAPRLSAHSDGIRMNAALFSRISALREQAASGDLELDAESLWLIERYHVEFVRAGAGLGEAEQQELRALNEELATLSARFGKQLLADTNELAVHFSSAEELDGLGSSELAAAREAAEQRGLEGFLVSLVLPTGHPYLDRLTVRASRERIFRASLQRGSRGGANDTREIVLRIARARARRAELLGYTSHAAYVLDDETAGTPEQVSRLLDQLVAPAVANVAAERAVLQELIDAEGGDFSLAPWDWAFYSEKLRQRDYELDTESLRVYFEAEAVLTRGVFHVGTELFGLGFEERHDLAGYHPEVRVFEVSRDGEPVGLYLLDLYTRDSKRGGAWMNSLVDQSGLLGDLPVVVNNLNVVKPPAGEPTLLTLDEATTLFHEFGHGLHGMMSRVRYPKFSGTNVPRDFVELPSQFNETWMLHPDVLPRFATHWKTGETIPAETVQKLKDTGTFNQGFRTTEYLTATLLDQAWHRLTPAEAEAITDVDEFEERVLREAGVLIPEAPTRYRSAYFAHIFGGGYSAAYYSYIWSEVLDADAERWFAEHGGLSREAGEHYLGTVLSVGGSRDPKQSYEAFRGSGAAIEPLLERRGLDRGTAA